MQQDRHPPVLLGARRGLHVQVSHVDLLALRQEREGVYRIGIVEALQFRAVGRAVAVRLVGREGAAPKGQRED